MFSHYSDLLLTLPVLHIGYTFITFKKNKLIFVKSKNIIKNKFYTELLITDHNDNTYKICDNIWLMKFGKNNKFNSIKEGNKIFISYYGIDFKFNNYKRNLVDINIENYDTIKPIII